MHGSQARARQAETGSRAQGVPAGPRVRPSFLAQSRARPRDQAARVLSSWTRRAPPRPVCAGSARLWAPTSGGSRGAGPASSRLVQARAQTTRSPSASRHLLLSPRPAPRVAGHLLLVVDEPRRRELPLREVDGAGVQEDPPVLARHHSQLPCRRRHRQRARCVLHEGRGRPANAHHVGVEARADDGPDQAHVVAVGIAPAALPGPPAASAAAPRGEEARLGEDVRKLLAAAAAAGSASEARRSRCLGRRPPESPIRVGYPSHRLSAFALMPARRPSLRAALPDAPSRVYRPAPGPQRGAHGDLDKPGRRRRGRAVCLPWIHLGGIRVTLGQQAAACPRVPAAPNPASRYSTATRGQGPDAAHRRRLGFHAAGRLGF